MTSRALRIYSAIVALVCGVAIAVAIQSRQSAAQADHWRRAWRAEARSWNAVARRAIAASVVLQRRNRAVTIRYNHLVTATRRSQHDLLQALHTARSTPPPPVYTPQPIIYRTVPAATPASLPAPAPTTRTS